MNNEMNEARNMKKVPDIFPRLSVWCITFIIAVSVNSAHAAIVNGTFDGIDFSTTPGTIPDWSTLGLTPLMRSPGDDTFAPLGPDVAFLGTPEDFTGPPSPALVSDIEMHLSLTSGAISGLGHSPVNGAVIAQTFTANAGDILTFEYNHLSIDDTPMVNDFSFVSLFGPGSSILQIIGDRSTLTTPPDNLSGMLSESGLKTFTSPPLLGGTYTLGIGVLNSEFSFGPSALLVDNVTLTAVPEARAWLMLGLVLFVAGVVRIVKPIWSSPL